MPGAAVAPADATSAQRANACREAARLHLAGAESLSPGLSQSIGRRAALAGRAASFDGAALLGKALRSSNPALVRLAEACAATPPALYAHARRSLDELAATRLTLAPCLRDLRAEHVLFTGDQVTGIVDWGSFCEDCPLLDLARLLGDFLPRSDWNAELAAYAEVRPLSPTDRALLRRLHEGAVLFAPWQWLEWLVGEERSFTDSAAVDARLDALAAGLRALPSATYVIS